MTSYIQSVSIANYGNYGKPTGTFTVCFDGGHTTYNLTEEQTAEIFAVCARIVNENKEKVAKALLQAEAGPNLLSPPKHSIDLDDEIPF